MDELDIYDLLDEKQLEENERLKRKRKRNVR